MEIKAELNYLNIAPRKVRLVAGLLKNMSVRQAMRELEYLPKRSALPLSKLLRSAVANAQHNFHVRPEGLYIGRIVVNPGPVLKRFQPRAFGRASPIRKRASHVIVSLQTHKLKSAGKLRVKKEAPEVREITSEDLRENAASSRKEERTMGGGKPRPKTPGFVRKMFRRKAI